MVSATPTKPPATLGRLATRMVSGDWFTTLCEKFADLDASPSLSGSVGEPVPVRKGIQGLYAIGNIRPHTDPDFERYSYILITRTNLAFLKTHGNEDLLLAPGMLVEFDSHRRHSLQQAGKLDITAWLPYDTEERVSLEEAEQILRQKAVGQWPCPRPQSNSTQIFIEGFEIIYDGIRVFVSDSDDRPIARFSSSFAEITQYVPSGKPRWIKTNQYQNPSPMAEDWNHFCDLIKSIFAINLPDAAQPYWVKEGMNA